MYNILVSCLTSLLKNCYYICRNRSRGFTIIWFVFFFFNKISSFFLLSFFLLNNYTDKFKYTLLLRIPIEVKKPSTRTLASYKLIIRIHKYVETYYQTSERAIGHIYFISNYKRI